ncbi:unnamed protein product [Musa acuminata var. zebrina]
MLVLSNGDHKELVLLVPQLKHLILKRVTLFRYSIIIRMDFIDYIAEIMNLKPLIEDAMDNPIPSEELLHMHPYSSYLGDQLNGSCPTPGTADYFSITPSYPPQSSNAYADLTYPNYPLYDSHQPHPWHLYPQTEANGDYVLGMAQQIEQLHFELQN